VGAAVLALELELAQVPELAPALVPELQLVVDFAAQERALLLEVNDGVAAFLSTSLVCNKPCTLIEGNKLKSRPARVATGKLFSAYCQ